MRDHARRWGIAVLLLLMMGPAYAGSINKSPRRVVSMNLCTDQLAMLIGGPGQLYSVSHFASQPDASVLAKEARRYVTNHGLAEEIFLMRPDLIIAGTFSTRVTVSLLRRLGFHVEEFSPAASFADIRRNIRYMGRILGRKTRAENLVQAFDEAIGGASRHGKLRGIAALYYAKSYTSGGGTLAAEVVEYADLINLGSKLGFSGVTKLPLEVLVMSKPDLIIRGSEGGKSPARAQEVFMHPALRALSHGPGRAAVADKYWICGAPFTAKAVSQLAKHEITNKPPALP